MSEFSVERLSAEMGQRPLTGGRRVHSGCSDVYFSGTWTGSVVWEESVFMVMRFGRTTMNCSCPPIYKKQRWKLLNANSPELRKTNQPRKLRHPFVHFLRESFAASLLPVLFDLRGFAP